MINPVTTELLTLCNAHPNAPVGEIGDIIITCSSITTDILKTKDSMSEQLEMINFIKTHIKKQNNYTQGKLFN